jgi:hypothetical protein
VCSTRPLVFAAHGIQARSRRRSTVVDVGAPAQQIGNNDVWSMSLTIDEPDACNSHTALAARARIQELSNTSTASRIREDEATTVGYIVSDRTSVRRMVKRTSAREGRKNECDRRRTECGFRCLLRPTTYSHPLHTRTSDVQVYGRPIGVVSCILPLLLTRTR